MPGHKCKKRQLYVFQVKKVIDEEELEVVVEDIRKERRKYVARVTVPECN